MLTATITSHGGQSDPGQGFKPVVGASDLVEPVSLGEISRLTRRSPDRTKVQVRQVVGEFSVLSAKSRVTDQLLDQAFDDRVVSTYKPK